VCYRDIAPYKPSELRLKRPQTNTATAKTATSQTKTATLKIQNGHKPKWLQPGLADRKSAFKMFNGNNQATSFQKLMNFLRPTISEFTLLKRAIFAAIRPQFVDDLHSLRWRFQTDWKTTILILAQ